MLISQTAEYALRAVVFLATSNEPRVNRTDIGDATQVPQDYLTKVMRELDRAGIVMSRRGPGGGYSLNESPTEITVYDVIDAVSSVPRIEACPLGIKDHIHLCPLHAKLDEAASHVEIAFRETKIADLIPARAKRKQCKFPMVLPEIN